MGDIIFHKFHRSSWHSTTKKAFMSWWYRTLQPLHFDQDSLKTHAFISVSNNNAYTGKSQPVHMHTLLSDTPYQDYAYGYHIPPIVNEKTPLRVSAIVINNHQHHYHNSDTDNTYICQFCLTSHSITSMGHVCLVEILYMYYCICLQGSLRHGNSWNRCRVLSTPKLHASLPLSLRTIHKRNYNVFRLYNSS